MMNTQSSRGSIAFFSTYRPPVPLDIFSSPVPCAGSAGKELLLTDGVSYNYNCRPIPPAALKELHAFLRNRNPRMAAECFGAATDGGLVFVSERDRGLETLHVALRLHDRVKVLRLADIYGADAFGGVRMEDSGCIAGGFKVAGTALTVGYSLVYVSTKENPAETRRTPWTVVYQINLEDGKTQRLTPRGQYDLSPAASPSGKMVAVASFAGSKWNGEIENLKTNIHVMNMDGHQGRRLLIKDGGWPTWGSDNVIFFHRGVDRTLPNGTVQTAWGVFRYDITTKVTVRVTPSEFNCMTPAAISETKVAVATIRKPSSFGDVRVEAQYRHIEVYDTAGRAPVLETEITRRGTSPKADHYNPFVLDGGKRIGYHRCRGSQAPDPSRSVHKLESPRKDVGLFRVSGVFPTISRDGSKLAFVDNEFRSVWLADKQGLRKVYETAGPDNVFSPVWNQNPSLDTLYICMGPSFNPVKPLEICTIGNVSSTVARRPLQANLQLTQGGFNNAFPSSNPEGTKFVFRSTRDGGPNKHKNLYIMDHSVTGKNGLGSGKVTRLTIGPWTDTHCQWSPSGDWIVFSSTRDKPAAAPATDFGLDPGYFAVYLVKASDPDVRVRVLGSASDLSGHVNHPVFSPDGRSIAVTADLAAVSADPISLPLFVHSVRPYGDIFVIDINTTDMKKNKDVQAYQRVTHSRYENSTPCWTALSPDDPRAPWSTMAGGPAATYPPGCPYAESFRMTGHLIVPKRCC